MTLMLFERFEDEGLAQYSYAVGSQAAGAVAIIDPRRDVDVYLDYARAKGVQIAYVLETHIHADYASGARELAERSGAALWVSGHDREERYEVAFPHKDLFEGDKLRIGAIELEAIHTPGHTPEHLSYLVYDTDEVTQIPRLLLSGDFLFIGSLGRPDLLGEAAKQRLAKQAFQSVREKLLHLPDTLEIHPGHGAGSMCGAGMKSQAMSTLGLERKTNPYLDESLSEAAFLDNLLSNTPPFPPYYLRMKQLNADGPPLLRGLPGTRSIEVADFKRLVDAEQHVVIDLREHVLFSEGHIPASFSVGAGPNLSTWAAWVVPYDRPLLLVADEVEEIDEAIRALIRVGLDDIQGYLAGGFGAWRDAGCPVQQLAQLSPADLHTRLQTGATLPILDVRTDEEWSAGHVEGAIHIMGGTLQDRLDRLPPRDQPLAVMCGSGYRATVAASVLERAGFMQLINVSGGMTAWEDSGLPTTRTDEKGERQ